ncbi:Zinc finger CCCH domain-containing protein 46 [Zea mays]|uniref:Zinc finger CCCH domain-containing protein 46 n=2 Tax=Zea mays TaxID=4577 RepID=A0A1D6L573_MAIZE|nr:Zinc finger CCCH domain-containing protein 46 [Zea mays]
MDGAIQRVYTRKNWSSMVLYNCSHPNNVVPLTSEIVSAQTGTFLHLLPGSTMTRSGNCPSPETSSSVAVCVWVVLCRPGTHASSGASSGSSPAEPNSCLSDRGTLPTLDIVCGLKIQRLLGSARFGASLCPWGVLSRASGDFCAARRSALGLRFMVLLIHVLFVGAVFILSPVSPFPLYSLRVAACSRATVGMLLGGEDMHRFPVRSPRMDRDDLIRSPAARRIVSNYFGYPEHTPPLLAPLLRLFRFDVRIPYQQKRMFGFVTFVYAETVKAILSKGNPHFVCDARSSSPTRRREAAARAPWRSRVRWLRVAHRIAGFQGPLRPPASFKCPGFLLSMKPLGYDV